MSPLDQSYRPSLLAPLPPSPADLEAARQQVSRERAAEWYWRNGIVEHVVVRVAFCTCGNGLPKGHPDWFCEVHR